MCEIYVGNYPSTYTRNEVLKLFDDFEGIVLQRCLKKNQKCYSFLTCVDESQMLDVVTTMNNLIVDGRNLIVRAKDQDLQDIIDDALEQGDATLPFHQRRKKTWNTSHLQAHKTKYQNDSASAENGRPYAGCTNSVNKDHQKIQGLSDAVYSNVETASSVSSTSSKRSNLSRDDTRILKQGTTQHTFGYVSILNFPLRTSVQDLYELFSDFDPVKIVMICNEPCKEKTLTEAIVCLSNEDNAVNAILNLDNTLFRRRVILVNDYKDYSLIPELLNIIKK